MAINNFNYKQTIDQATAIRNKAAEMRRIKEVTLGNAVASIGAVWKGESANLYLRHCGQTLADIEATANELDKIADKINAVAQILKKADDDAKAKLKW